MAASALADKLDVFRGLSLPSWEKKGKVTKYAFLLRPEKHPHPIEKELSLGLTEDAAVDDLELGYVGVGKLSVGSVHRLPHALSVQNVDGEPMKAQLVGLPLYSTEKEQRDLALKMARDLADIAEFIPRTPETP